RSAAKASSASATAISTLRLLATAGESSAGASTSSTTISSSEPDMSSRSSLGDEPSLGHQLLVESVVLFEEFRHLRPGEKDRLERLLLHVVFVVGRLYDLLQQIDIECLLLRRYLAGEEHGAQHEILHVETFFLAGRNVIPRHALRDFRLVFNALLVEQAQRPHLPGAPDFQILGRIVDVRGGEAAEPLHGCPSAGLVSHIRDVWAGLLLDENGEHMVLAFGAGATHLERRISRFCRVDELLHCLVRQGRVVPQDELIERDDGYRCQLPPIER